MHANTILALSGLLSIAAAVPHFSALKHHHHNRRALVWETVTEEVVETVAVTKTIWLEPGQSPPAGYTPPAAFTPAAYAPASHHDTSHAHHNSPAAPKYTPPAPSSAPAVPAYSPSAQSSPVQPPASVYTPPTSSYVAPPAPTSSYVPPPAPVTPSSSYVAPAPSSSYVAPAPSSSAPTTGGSGWTSDLSLPADAPAGLTYGMGKSGTSYTGDLTYYAIGMGACGWTNTEAEAVVAISHDIFDSYNDNGNPNANPLCGKFVTITDANGNKRYHKIVDRCVGCDSGSLDLPEGFFNSITDNGDGRVSGMSWSFT